MGTQAQRTSPEQLTREALGLVRQLEAGMTSTTMLQQGDKEPSVTTLQQLLLRLHELGWLELPRGFKADGDFGGRTDRAVKALQRMLEKKGSYKMKIALPSGGHLDLGGVADMRLARATREWIEKKQLSARAEWGPNPYDEVGGVVPVRREPEKKPAAQPQREYTDEELEAAVDRAHAQMAAREKAEKAARERAAAEAAARPKEEPEPAEIDVDEALARAAAVGNANAIVAEVEKGMAEKNVATRMAAVKQKKPGVGIVLDEDHVIVQESLADAKKKAAAKKGQDPHGAEQSAYRARATYKRLLGNIENAEKEIQADARAAEDARRAAAEEEARAAAAERAPEGRRAEAPSPIERTVMVPATIMSQGEVHGYYPGDPLTKVILCACQEGGVHATLKEVLAHPLSSITYTTVEETPRTREAYAMVPQSAPYEQLASRDVEHVARLDHQGNVVVYLNDDGKIVDAAGATTPTGQPKAGLHAKTVGRYSRSGGNYQVDETTVSLEYQKYVVGEMRGSQLKAQLGNSEDPHRAEIRIGSRAKSKGKGEQVFHSWSINNPAQIPRTIRENP